MTKQMIRRACALLAALLLVFAAAAAAEAAATAAPEDGYAERLEQARLKYNSKTVNVYRNGWGYVQDGKINVRFYKSKEEKYYTINIRESLKITDEAEMEAILELVMQNENYSDEIYGGMAFMKAQWITHNLAYELATGSDETKQIIAALAGEPAKKVARRAKELDLTPVEAMSIQERTLTERIRQLFVIPATHDTETQPD